MRLIVESGPDQGREVALDEGPVVIGSGDGADMRLRGRGVAGRHARLQALSAGTVLLEPLAGAESTLVDGTPVRGRVPVGAGVPVRLGEVVLVIAPSPGSRVPDANGVGSPVPSRAPTREERRRRWAVAGIGAMVLMALLLLLEALAIAGPADAGVAFLVAVLPAPVLVGVVLLIDRYEPEPPHMLALTFLWGATAAVLFASLLNTFGGDVALAALGPGTGDLFTMVVIAPVVEESLKALAVLFVFWRRRDEFNGIIDGIVYSAMVGLGFEVTENTFYYARAIMEGQDTFVVTVVARAVLSPFAHPLFTSMVGIGLALSMESGRGRRLLPLAGLGAAIGLHMLWNGSAALGLVFFLVYFLVIIPTLAIVVVVALRALRREEELLRRYLAPDVASGLLTPEEVQKLASVRLRRRAERESARLGRRARRLRRQFHHAATELAFVRHRRRTLPAASAPSRADEAYWEQQVRELKTRVKGPEAFVYW